MSEYNKMYLKMIKGIKNDIIEYFNSLDEDEQIQVIILGVVEFVKDSDD